MAGWGAAAEMVAQHHEMPDGRGYQEGITAPAICDGAKILAIVDAFESVMLKHASRGRNRSVLRAVAELTAALITGRLKHVIGARFALKDIAAAHEVVEAAAVTGNVVIDLAKG